MTDLSLFDVLMATWPPARTHRAGPWQICEGRGGGQRVSAARALEDVQDTDIPLAEVSMRDLEQTPLFMIREGETALDATLEKRAYTISDPTCLMIGDIAPLASEPVPPVTAFTIWPPLVIMREMWEMSGLDPARFDVMDRAANPKIGVLGRAKDNPAGCAFAAMHRDIVMVHAVEVLSDYRRLGLATNMMRAVAHWGVENGAKSLALAVVRENSGAIAFYRSLGMSEAGGYHYRRAPNS